MLVVITVELWLTCLLSDRVSPPLPQSDSADVDKSHSSLFVSLRPKQLNKTNTVEFRLFHRKWPTSITSPSQDPLRWHKIYWFIDYWRHKIYLDLPEFSSTLKLFFRQAGQKEVTLDKSNLSYIHMMFETSSNIINIEFKVSQCHLPASSLKIVVKYQSNLPSLPLSALSPALPSVPAVSACTQR